MQIGFQTTIHNNAAATRRVATAPSGQTPPRFGKEHNRTTDGLIGVGILGLLTTAAFWALYTRFNHDTLPKVKPQPVMIEQTSPSQPSSEGTGQ